MVKVVYEEMSEVDKRKYYFNQIKQIRDNADWENYKDKSSSQIYMILQKYKNDSKKNKSTKPKKQFSKEKPDNIINPDYDTDESIISKLGSEENELNFYTKN